MPMVSVTFEFKTRRIPLEEDENADFIVPGVPENWQTETYGFAFETENGIQPLPGMAQHRPAPSSRHVLVIVPKAGLNSDDPSTWPEYTLRAGETGDLRTFSIGGFEVITDPINQTHPVLTSTAEPPARIYYIEGEDRPTVGKYKGLWGRWWSWWW